MKWISVKEKLPEKGTPVLCYCESDWKCWQAVGEWDDTIYPKQFSDAEGDLPATHWMPLPDPPEEEK